MKESCSSSSTSSYGTLDRLLLNDHQAASALCQILSSLQHIHDHGSIHRDIKPANILVGKVFSVVIADFGVAQVQKDDYAKSGTFAYMAPEVTAAERYNSEVDMWSTAVTMMQVVGHPCQQHPTPNQARI